MKGENNMQYSYKDMVNNIVMWRDALEKGHSVKIVFDSMCSYLGEQQREIDRLRKQVVK